MPSHWPASHSVKGREVHWAKLLAAAPMCAGPGTALPGDLSSFFPSKSSQSPCAF